MATFIDTSYVIALANTADRYHERASALALQPLGPFITTEAVLTEIGNALARLRWRQYAVSILQRLQEDPDIEVVPVSSALFGRALRLYGERMDKEWGLTDCISFLVMQDRVMTEALTTDQHFQQAGFRALLLEDGPV